MAFSRCAPAAERNKTGTERGQLPMDQMTAVSYHASLAVDGEQRVHRLAHTPWPHPTFVISRRRESGRTCLLVCSRAVVMEFCAGRLRERRSWTL